MINKKAATYGVWVEVLICVVLIVAFLGIIGADMNNTYDKSIDLTKGLATNDTQEALKNLADTMGTDIATGQSSQSSLGLLQLTTLPKILLTVNGLIWDFIRGNFITNAIGLLNLGQVGTYLAIMLRVLLWIGLAFVLIKIVTRIVV